MNFFFLTRRIQTVVISTVIMTLFMMATIVTVHTFMYESHDSNATSIAINSSGINSNTNDLPPIHAVAGLHDGHDMAGSNTMTGLNPMVGSNQMASDMMSEECCCQPAQCQSIMAQIDLSKTGIWMPDMDFSVLSPISYFQPIYQTTAQATLVVENAQLTPTHPPINIRFQSFLI